MGKYTQVIILCEDKQQETFARTFLTSFGAFEKRRINVKKSPTGEGSGEQFVKNNFSKEVSAYRSKNYLNICLIAIIDADNHSVDEIRKDLIECLELPLQSNEKVAIFIPKRNIETWINFIDGNTVDEVTEYPHAAKESECKMIVKKFSENCRNNNTTSGNPPESLKNACIEVRKLIEN
mgnify:CR=1 FL=1